MSVNNSHHRVRKMFIPHSFKKCETLAFPIYPKQCTRYSKLDFGGESSMRDQRGICIFALNESVFDIQNGIVDFEYPT
ncbi:hypothetical protein C8R11_10213 [Nitrosomonas aestuarii]|nr:hypothetical protein C8R11_10213 [Nitrosomonas aestuarii]